MKYSLLVENGNKKDWDIYRKSLTGGAAIAVAASNSVEYGPALSPNDNEVAYIRLKGQQCKVLVQTLHQGQPTELADCTTKFPTLVDWSPNSPLIAFTAKVDNNTQRRSIKLVDRDTGLITPLTNNVAKDSTDYYPRFSPNGSKVAFLRGVPKPEHLSNIFITDIKSSQQRLLCLQTIYILI